MDIKLIWYGCVLYIKTAEAFNVSFRSDTLAGIPRLTKVFGYAAFIGSLYLFLGIEHFVTSLHIRKHSD